MEGCAIYIVLSGKLVRAARIDYASCMVSHGLRLA